MKRSLLRGGKTYSYFAFHNVGSVVYLRNSCTNSLCFCKINLFQLFLQIEFGADPLVVQRGFSNGFYTRIIIGVMNCPTVSSALIPVPFTSGSLSAQWGMAQVPPLSSSTPYQDNQKSSRVAGFMNFAVFSSV